MRLEDILDIRIREINEKLKTISETNETVSNKLTKIEEQIYACETLLGMLNDTDNIKDDIRAFVDDSCSLLDEYSYNEFKEELAVIVIAIKNNLELDSNQEERLIYFINNLKNILKKSEEKRIECNNLQIENNKEYSELKNEEENIELLIFKITEQEEGLDEDNFNLVYALSSNEEFLSYSQRKDLLIQFKKYNDSYTLNEEKKSRLLSLEEINSFFKDKKISTELNSKFEDEIKKIDLENASEIIDYLSNQYLDKKPLIKYFNSSSLLTILLYSNKENVEETYNKMLENNKVYMIFFDTPSIWCSNTKKRTYSSYKRKNKTNGKNKPSPITLEFSSYGVTYEEMLKNEELLKRINPEISLKNSEYYNLFKTSHELLKKKYNICDLYGLNSKKTVAMLRAGNLLEKCDLCVELGILNGDEKQYGLSSNLIAYSPSRVVNYPVGFYEYLSYLKQNSIPSEFYSNISRRSTFDMQYIKDGMRKVGFDPEGTDKEVEKVEKFVSEQFEDNKKVIPNYELYESIVSADDRINYEKEVLNNKLIQELENNFKRNDYQYVFGNQIISRYKVLRLASILLNKYGELNEEQIKYCITRGSYINEQNMNLINENISELYKGGQGYGILR